MEFVVFHAFAAVLRVPDYSEGAGIEVLGDLARPSYFEVGFEGGPIRIKVGLLFFRVGVEEY